MTDLIWRHEKGKEGGRERENDKHLDDHIIQNNTFQERILAKETYNSFPQFKIEI